MTTPAPLGRLTAQDVQALAHAKGQGTPCAACKPFASPGWETFPDSADPSVLQPLGALWLAGDDEPTLEEAPRPTGIDRWSAQAPISLQHHPDNRCEVWACVQCGLPFLRYTEYGGYYIERRIRQLQPQRLLAG
jgi:hypothetical protein